MSIDLTTKYGGLTLSSPVIVGACPLNAQQLVRISMLSAGAGAIVLPSLFGEQVIQWKVQNGHALSKRERNLLERAERIRANTDCDDAASYLTMVQCAADQISIPIIASLNGDPTGDWLEFATALETAGASAVEWSICPSAPGNWEGPREIEDAIVDGAARISRAIKIPLFLKLSRRYTSISELARRLQCACDGLVLFGQAPEVDILLDSLNLISRWGLTKSGGILKSLESIMRVRAYCPELSLAASGGIGSTSDLIKSLLGGADAAMVTSAIYRNSPDVIRMLLDGLVVFMEHHRMQTMEDLYASRPAIPDTDDDRLGYVSALSSPLNVCEEHSADHVIRSDRWGHPQAPH